MKRSIDDAGNDVLMPMHVRLSPCGRIAHAGPTLRRLGLAALDGEACFWDIFEVLRPIHLKESRRTSDLYGQPLRLRFRDRAESTAMKGLAVQMSCGGTIVNLSFGIGLVDAVARYGLTQGDFAANDLAVEMLYLFEAKSAVMHESRRLNLHLDDARSIAEQQAFTDELTGLGNRRAMEHALELLLDRGETFSLLHIDLDHFKAVNDTFGHAAGDAALSAAARVLRDETRQQDIPTRVGGDEFVVLVYGDVSKPSLMALGQRIIQKIEEPIAFEGNELSISASIGVGIPGQRSDETQSAFLSRVDAALYASKSAGRGRVSFAA